MKSQIKDYKNPLTYAFWSKINAIALQRRFRHIDIAEQEKLPRDRPFILVCNHISRWDGLLMYHLLGRPANFMVSPNELLGFQGSVLKSMGAFPATAKLDLHSHIQRQIEKKEPIVIFPEGDIFQDGSTHAFKSGTARLALSCARAGFDVPVFPAAVRYEDDIARIMVASPVEAAGYLKERADGFAGCIQALTERLYREVCHLRYQLGSESERQILFRPAVPAGWWSSANAQ